MRALVLAFIVFVTAFALGTFGATAARALWHSPDTEIEVPSEKTHERNPELFPVRLRIPALNIDAHIQHVGVNAQGNMATPSNYTDTGWYKYGPAPGEGGSAVIAGHVNNGLGRSGVFERLADLEPGDDIYVTRADGSDVHFVVAGLRAYPYDDAPEEIIFNPTGSTRLNLITCEGKWVKEEKTYDQRLVVFARLAEE